MLDQTVLELHLHQNATGTHCPLSPEQIATHEAAGRIVDLDTGDILPDVTADTLVSPILHTPQDIDALVIELHAALSRLEQRPTGGNAFLRGFKYGAQSAYLDILRELGGGAWSQR